MPPADVTFFFNSTPPNLGLTLMRIGTSNGDSGENLGGGCTSVGIACLASSDIRTIDFTNALAANPLLRVWASAYSPPAIYTTNTSTRCTPGVPNSGLATAFYSQYATWLGNFALTMKNTYGVPLYALSVQNEPDICNVPYDQAYWTGAQMQSFIKGNLGPTFASDSLSTLIMMPEPAGNYDYNNYAGPCMTDSSCSPFVGITSWHDYDASYLAPDTVNSPTNTYASSGKQYWETEVSNLPGTGPNAPSCPGGGAYCGTISDALMWAAFIDDRLVNENANSYNYWQFMSFNNTDNEGLTQANGTVALRAYVFGQYADFVLPGMVRLTTTHNPQTGVTVSAYKNSTTGAFAIVATKYTTGSVNQTFTFSGVCPASVTPYITSATQHIAVQSAVAVTGCSFTYTLPAQSVTTFVGTALTTYYISSSAGSDSNNGTSKATPWAHLPGMATATGNAAANVPAAGNQYILKGCDTWTNSNFPVNWTWSGASGSPIYIGVDQTWYNTSTCPSAWNRPIWDAGSTEINGGTDNVFLYLNSTQYVTVDNVEMRSMYWSGPTVYGNIAFVNLVPSSNETISNSYFHGWTHGTSSTTDDIFVILGSTFSAGNPGNKFLNNVVDGGVGQNSGTELYGGFQYIQNNVFLNANTAVIYQGTYAGGGVLSGNLIYNINPSFAGNHPNAIENNGTGIWYTYNNVVHDTQGEADFMANSGGGTEYIWNNLWYNLFENEPATGSTSAGSATVYFWNNTVAAPTTGGGQPCIRVGHSQTVIALTFWNNQCITNNTAAVDPTFPSPNIKNTTLMPTVTAASQGYTSSQTFAYSPTLGGSTIGAGTKVCGVLFTCTANLAAAITDTTYACALSTTAGGVVVPSCPARNTVARPSVPDTGAYQFPTTGAPGMSCTSMSAFPTQTVGTPSAAQSSTCTNTGTGSLAIASITLAGTNPSDFSLSPTNTCPAALVAGGICTIYVTFTPSAAGSRSASVVITDNAVTSPQMISLTGTGAAGSSIWTHVNSGFANAASSATCAVTISASTGQVVDFEVAAWNTSNVAATLSSIKFSDGSSFTVTPNSPSPNQTNAGLTWASYNLSAAGSETNITATMGASVSFLACFANVESLPSGYVAAPDTDVASPSVITPGTLINLPSLTPSTSQEDVFTVAIASGNYISAVGSPFTSSGTLKPNAGAPQNGSAAGWVINQTSAVNPNMTDSTSGIWSAMVGALKAVATGSTPTISSLSAISGNIGATFTITGTNFGATVGTSTVGLNGQAVTCSGWSATSLTGCTVPTGATTGNVLVTVSGANSNGVLYTVTPHLTSLSVSTGPVGTLVTATGTGLGALQGLSNLAFNGMNCAPTGWSAISITCVVPTLATTGNVVATVGRNASNAIAFTVTPTITLLSPSTGPVGTSVVITGTTFSAAPTVTFNGTSATVTSYTATSISTSVPSGATYGYVIVTISGHASNGLLFVLTSPPSTPIISTVAPNSGAVGTIVTITGSNFGAVQNQSTATFNNVSMPITSWSNTSIVATIPAGITSGPIIVNVAGNNSNGVNFGVVTIYFQMTSGTISSGTVN